MDASAALPLADSNPRFDSNSRACQITLSMYKDPTTSFITQSPDSLTTCTNAGKSLFSPEALASEDESLASQMGSLRDICIHNATYAAERCTKPYNVSIMTSAREMKTVYFNVPKTVRKGLFRTETVVEKVAQPQSVLVKKKVLFQGWLLEHFERNELYSATSSESFFWDYCLSKDGGLYMVTSSNELSSGQVTFGDYHVHELLFNSPAYMNLQHQNIFFAVNAGFVGSLDVVAPGDEGKCYNVSANDENLEFNFPIEDPDCSHVAFSTIGDGLYTRLKMLLSNEG